MIGVRVVRSLQKTRLDHQDCSRLSAVIIGDPESIFPRKLAEYWCARGMDVTIVTRHWTGETTFPCGAKVLASEDYESISQKRLLRCLHIALQHIETIAVKKLGKKRYEKVMGPKAESPYRPSFVGPVVNAFSIARLVRKLKPDFVFGQEAFAYGLATALCRQVPKILMPWSGDIYRYAETSPFAFRMVQYSLRHVDLVCPTSLAAVPHVCARYGVSPEKVRAISWGVDRTMFRKATPKQRRHICSKYGIDPDYTIINNCRRFKPIWGCFSALEAFMHYAREDDSTHFVMFGGAGSESFIQQARETLRKHQVSKRFTFFENNIPLEQYAELLSISEVFVSLSRMRDMRSSSILQAAASGAVPVLSDQDEYREMEKLCFKALFVGAQDVGGVVTALRRYAHNPGLRAEYAAQNLQYIERNEDSQQQMDVLISVIKEVCQLTIHSL